VLPNKKVNNFVMKKVQKFSSLKIVGTNIWPGICYLLNLQNGFQNLTKNEVSAGSVVPKLGVNYPSGMICNSLGVMWNKNNNQFCCTL